MVQAGEPIIVSGPSQAARRDLRSSKHVLAELAEDLVGGSIGLDKGADAFVIVTEWDPFRALDLGRLMGLMAQPVLVDLRNIYRPEDMAARGFEYSGIGRG